MTQNFDIDVQTVQVYKCADGVEFTDLAQAKEHTAMLKIQAADEAFLKEMESKLESYLNQQGLVGRNRVQKQTIITQFLQWEKDWNGEFIKPPVETPKEPVQKETKLDEEVVTNPQVNPVAQAEYELQKESQESGDDFLSDLDAMGF